MGPLPSTGDIDPGIGLCPGRYHTPKGILRGPTYLPLARAGATRPDPSLMFSGLLYLASGPDTVGPVALGSVMTVRYGYFSESATGNP